MAPRVLVRGKAWIAGAVGFVALAAAELASDLTEREGASRWRCWRYGHNRHSPALDDCRWRGACREMGCGGRARSIMAAPDRRWPIGATGQVLSLNPDDQDAPGDLADGQRLRNHRSKIQREP